LGRRDYAAARFIFPVKENNVMASSTPPITPIPEASGKGTPVVSERIQYDDNPRPPVLSAHRLIGEKVYNPSGDHLGDIEDIMLDIPTGRIAYAVLSVSGFFGIGKELFAIPWRTLMIDANHERFVMDADKEKLKNAMAFGKDYHQNATDRHWAIRLHDFYQARPYWE